MKILFRLRRGCYWANLLGVVGSVLVFVGLLGPWLSRGYDPWYTFNYETRRTETHYRTIVEISPLRAELIEDDVIKSSFWFYDFNLSPSISLAAIGFMVAAVLSLVSFGRWRVSLAGCLLYVISSMLFLSSFGRGLSVGVTTFFGWGLCVGAAGGIVMFASFVAHLIWYAS
jgi:hypothetical protein